MMQIALCCRTISWERHDALFEAQIMLPYAWYK